MKIGFDAKRLFYNKTGLGNYSRTLVNNLQTFYPHLSLSLFANDTEKSSFYADFQNYKIVDPHASIPSYWRSFSINRDIKNSGIDIYHGLSNELPFSIKSLNVKKIVTIHDLFYDKYSQDFSPIDRSLFKLKTEFACKNADHIVAISQSTKEDIINLIGIDSSKVSVVYQSCNPLFQKNKTSTPPHSIIDLSGRKIPFNYFLFVGSLNERKNIMGLLKALALLPESHRMPLVIVGQGNKRFTKQLVEFIAQNKLEKLVFRLGQTPNEDLISLYLHARFTCLPSYYEGFGIPIIESLFCKTPVMAGKNSALIEATGLCGALVDPFSVEEMSYKLHLMISDDNLISKYSSHIENHLVKFTSKVTANSMFSVYRTILE